MKFKRKYRCWCGDEACVAHNATMRKGIPVANDLHPSAEALAPPEGFGDTIRTSAAINRALKDTPPKPFTKESIDYLVGSVEGTMPTIGDSIRAKMQPRAVTVSRPVPKRALLLPHGGSERERYIAALASYTRIHVTSHYQTRLNQRGNGHYWWGAIVDGHASAIHRILEDAPSDTNLWWGGYDGQLVFVWLDMPKLGVVSLCLVKPSGTLSLITCFRRDVSYIKIHTGGREVAYIAGPGFPRNPIEAAKLPVEEEDDGAFEGVVRSELGAEPTPADEYADAVRAEQHTRSVIVVGTEPQFKASIQGWLDPYGWIIEEMLDTTNTTASTVYGALKRRQSALQEADAVLCLYHLPEATSKAVAALAPHTRCLMMGQYSRTRFRQAAMAAGMLPLDVYGAEARTLDLMRGKPHPEVPSYHHINSGVGGLVALRLLQRAPRPKSYAVEEEQQQQVVEPTQEEVPMAESKPQPIPLTKVAKSDPDADRQAALELVKEQLAELCKTYGITKVTYDAAKGRIATQRLVTVEEEA
jgi:hypothetical protein